MSQMEFRVGKVKEIAKAQDGFEAKVRWISETYNIPLNKLIWEYKEELQFKDKHIEMDDKFVYTKGRTFEILEDTDMEEEGDIAQATVIDGDTYKYTLRYYNGGASYSEMLGEALNKVLPKKE